MKINGIKYVEPVGLRKNLINFFKEEVLKNNSPFEVVFSSYKKEYDNFIRVRFFPSLRDKNDFLIKDCVSIESICEGDNIDYRFNRNYNADIDLSLILLNEKIKKYYLNYFFGYLIFQAYQETRKKRLSQLEKIIKKNFDSLVFYNALNLRLKAIEKSLVDFYISLKQKLPKEDYLIMYKEIAETTEFKKQKKMFYVNKDILKIVLQYKSYRNFNYYFDYALIPIEYVVLVVEMGKNAPVLNEYSLKCIEVLEENEQYLRIRFLEAPILTKIKTIKSEKSLVPKIYWNMFFKKIKKYEITKSTNN